MRGHLEGFGPTSQLNTQLNTRLSSGVAARPWLMNRGVRDFLFRSIPAHPKPLLSLRAGYTFVFLDMLLSQGHCAQEHGERNNNFRSFQYVITILNF